MVKPAYAYSVTIGRNIGNEEMPQSQWNAFIDYVTGTLAGAYRVYGRNSHKSAYFTEKHYGIGMWNDIPEESCKITLVAETKINSDGINVIKECFKSAANTWKQEAIAFSIGTSELIER